MQVQEYDDNLSLDGFYTNGFSMQKCQSQLEDDDCHVKNISNDDNLEDDNTFDLSMC